MLTLPSFSRHAKAQVSLVLVIWLNGNIQKIYRYLSPASS